MKFLVVFVMFLSFSDVCAEGFFSSIWGVISGIFPGKKKSGNFPLKKIHFTTTKETNSGGAMKVHFVLVYDEPVFTELGQISARRYFEVIDQLRKDHPDKLKVIKLDLIAEDNFGLDFFDVETYADIMDVYGGYIFADYNNNKTPHRVTIPEYDEVRVVFGKDDLDRYPEDLSLDKERVIDATKLKNINSENLDEIIEEYYSTDGDVVAFAKEPLSLGQDHYDREDYINMGLLDDPYDE